MVVKIGKKTFNTTCSPSLEEMEVTMPNAINVFGNISHEKALLAPNPTVENSDI